MLLHGDLQIQLLPCGAGGERLQHGRRTTAEHRRPCVQLPISDAASLPEPSILRPDTRRRSRQPLDQSRIKDPIRCPLTIPQLDRKTLSAGLAGEEQEWGKTDAASQAEDWSPGLETERTP